MNYLAHALLAQPGEATLIGNLAGDHVKGRLENLGLHPGVREGVARHRAVDALSDRHHASLGARALFPEGERRYAGIVLDVFFDHLLCRHWHRFSTLPLGDFQRRIYATIRERDNWLPGSFSTVGPVWADAQWLSAYETVEGVAAVLGRLAQRRPGAATVPALLERALDHEEAIEAAFLTLFPDLVLAQGRVLDPHVKNPTNGAD